ncbi:hypothetical protein [Paenibacillus etheri]|uniref:Uncharacterized protein n=1 Tax=Paenibacillus etheri TaxID=1306852 RepID=A0A0W1APU5_9BACL|nr:hypothetical protein [Paenibacillus etheri]KTD83367.1 hypothetical protein UQ64_02880 [Paenibacillus etheri]
MGSGLVSFFAGRYVTKGLLSVAIGGLMIEGLLLMGISISNHFAIAFMLYILLSFAGGTGNACLGEQDFLELLYCWQGMR